ncbi:MAG TPA: iron-sulfur cluster assembly scaffold protein [Candidatus Acidoferrum sp.]|jgi:nitrogen fixation NifU-like protein
MFSETLLDHFQRPRNAGELPGADAMVEVSNPVCGDVLRLAAKIVDGRIGEVRFLCRGCTTAIACGSMLTEKMQGAEWRSLRGITAEDLAEALGGLPEASYHGAQLAEDALRGLAAELGKVE